ncbi:PD-(D/E)XK nuclease family protein [Butyrivibrio sp. MC2021]|uniref:PD-(D/E)XK nuclease family protein n=1 Tax=Butyrivibrio sp. MC2021 TaxID=1408306 RepID=UPI00047A780D|nr:PD-(D/E)XK nuclease family protein [Butyrivibrio sp. MC2021]
MLRFCFGASGAGKSTTLYKDVIDRSLKDNTGQFFIIVPDQFTMQTQMDVVKMHPLGAIMNIDVLSFGRLSYRIFEETGLGSFSVLDDVGKSLVLRHVADTLGERLPVIGKNMHKPGYIDEVKSTISEFMQYGIGDQELSVLLEKSSGKGALSSKLKDLKLLYSEFLKYIEGNYITTEETLDLLCKAIDSSRILKGSVVIFDGFTGFTPIQYRVIKKLLATCSEVMVSVTISPEEDPYDPGFEEQELFMLGKKTVRDLEKLMYQVEQENMASVGSLPDFETYRKLRREGESGDIRLTHKPVYRLEGNAPASFLEENLFRYNNKKYTAENETIEVYSAGNPAEEIRQTMIKITDIVRDKNLSYRDIAIVCGSLEDYGDIISREADKFGIPVYIDRNMSLLLNPFVEYVTSAINIVISGYKYEDVFHYMRSGMTDFSREDTDILENYVRALGISGTKQWEDKFLRRMPRRFKPKNEDQDLKEVELLARLEDMRSRITEQLKPLFDQKSGTVKDITSAIISVIEKNRSEEKLQQYADRFKKAGNNRKAREYDQIYEKIMNLLLQMDSLIGGETLTLPEYRDILEVGFGKIEVGTIPQDVDRIIVGDIERSRLKEIRVLFFMGVNDGAIPKSAGGGGILSDIDRQFLSELDTGIELAPTPRQQMYIQRLYLYMNLTKPTDKLFLSYSEIDKEGKSLRPAYLIPKLMQMFEGLTVERPQEGSFESQNVSVADSCDTLSEMLRSYAAGTLYKDKIRDFYTLYKVLQDYSDKNQLLERLKDAAFSHYEDKPLAKELARALYGAILENSVSRLEKFASCCYAHFLRYGLDLQERKEYKFDVADLGEVYHDVLEKYTSEVISRKLDFRSMSKEDSDEILKQALTTCADKYGNTILYSSARNQFLIDRIYRILSRTVDTLKYQLSKGRFEPAFVEMDFRQAGDIADINVELSEEEKGDILQKMKLRGRIDRVDLYEDPDHVYIKIIDFKSGKKKFSIASLYHGLSLQLVMYMNVARAMEKAKNPDKEIVPAAVLYYHVDDPIIGGQEDMQPDAINDLIRNELRTTGLVNADDTVVQLLHEGLDGRSDVIPVKLLKKGGYSKDSGVAGSEDYQYISRYVNDKVREYGKRILQGDISVNPYEAGNRSSCTYCDYRSVCGYDDKIPGYSKRTLDMDNEAALEAIRNKYKEQET